MCIRDRYTRAKACAQRIFEVIDTDSDIQDGTAPALPEQAGQVEFRDVSFKYETYGTGDNVLSHVSFTSKPGQVIAVIGGTGEGKSTLVNLIPRFLSLIHIWRTCLRMPPRLFISQGMFHT